MNLASTHILHTFIHTPPPLSSPFCILHILKHTLHITPLHPSPPLSTFFTHLNIPYTSPLSFPILHSLPSAHILHTFYTHSYTFSPLIPSPPLSAFFTHLNIHYTSPLSSTLLSSPLSLPLLSIYLLHTLKHTLHTSAPLSTTRTTENYNTT